MRHAAAGLLATVLAALPLLPAAAPAQSPAGVGQFFTAPATDGYLASVFTGTLHVVSGGTYTYLLFPLAGATVGGPALFTRAAVPGPIAEDQTVPVGVLLTPGARYAFLMQADPSGDPVGFRAFDSADAIAGGEFGFCNFAGSCQAFAGTLDVDGFALRFTAAPTATAPEPSGLALLGGGLVALGGGARRRRRAA